MRIKRFVIPCLLTALMLVLFASSGFGKDIVDNAGFRKPVGAPARRLLNISLLSLWVYTNGISAHNPNTDGSGLIYPRGTYGAGVIYLDGLMIGGYVDDGRLPELRTIGTTYRTSWQPGWMLSKGVAVDEDLDEVRMYRIRPDFASADLAQDAAELVDGSVADVTAADVDAVRAQYLLDWQEWPVDVGAPFDDVGYLGADGETIVDAGNSTLDYGEDTNMNGVLDSGEDANGNGQLDGEVPGFAGADQVLWFACNDLDESSTQSLGGCPPIGFEMQVTLWGYNRTDALGNVAFKRYRIFYKGTATTPTDAEMTEVYFAHFSDPDLGAYGDDFVGCDTTLDMMFVYNSVSQDQNFVPYNYPPPAIGYDFLQGPMVPGSAGDVAIYDMQLVEGMQNLGMTAFNYFASGSPISDPDMGQYEGTEQWYNLMRGLTPRGGVAFTLNDGVTATPFPLSGDPVTNEGDLDGVILAASDRRMQFITGPFDIQFGTQQELVMAYVAGMGADRLSSVSVMKFNDISAQYAYDNFFDLAKPPDTPKMELTALDRQIFINWGYDAASVASTEGAVKKGFAFEGYNVYQMPTAASGLADAKKLATYDVVNETTTILDDQFDQVSGGILSIPSQTGKNTGIVRTMMVNRDAFTDGPLVNGTTYYFAVTAYSYNGDPEVPIHALESQVLVKSVTPKTENPGVRYQYEIAEGIPVEHTGVSDGSCTVTVVDPTKTTGHDYQVSFENTAAGIVWHIDDLTTGQRVMANQANQSGDDNYLNIDGVQVKVMGPAAGFHGIYIMHDGVNPRTPDTMGPEHSALIAHVWDYGWNVDEYWEYVILADGQRYWCTQGGGTAADYDSYVARVLRNDDATRAIPYDFEWRWTEKDATFVGGWNDPGPFPGNFEIWCIGSNTGDDTSDDYRMIPGILPEDFTEEGEYRFYGDVEDSGADNDPATNWVYWYQPVDMTPGTAGFDAYVADPNPDDWGQWGDEVLARTRFFCHNGVGFEEGELDASLLSTTDPTAFTEADLDLFRAEDWFEDIENGTSDLREITIADGVASFYKETFPPAGAIYRWVTNKPNVPGQDTFEFTTLAPAYSEETAKEDIKNVNVFPNPYYGVNSRETTENNRYVTFNHLPQKANFMIFDLAGTLVRKLEKDNDSQYYQWDLRNDNDLPVASGIYIVRIEFPDLDDKVKILKVALCVEAQFLQYY